jgi:asparagine synthase (glutamine-hydrolysing)
VPGISFVYRSRDLSDDREKIDHGLDSVLNMPGYAKEYLMEDKRFTLACTRPQHYPVRLLDLGECAVVIEGKLYDLNEELIFRKIHTLTQILFEKPSNSEQLRNWFLGTDGDFVIFALRKGTGDIAILNDALGRLPVYCSREMDEVIISRELRFVAKLRERIEYDRVAIAEYLLFGYACGRRTFLQNTERLPPSALLRIRGATTSISLRKLHVFNFDQKISANKTLEENGAELARLFRISCQRRAHQSALNFVALSGGMDSRSVAVGLHEEGIPFIAGTFAEVDKPDGADPAIAGLLARSYNCKWERYNIRAPSGAHLMRLLRIKNSTNHFAESKILSFFEQISARHGNVVYLTGDGGDKVLPNLKPSRHFAGLGPLADFILQVHQIAAMKTVSTLTRTSQNELRKELVALLASYPERDLAQKYVHFVIYEEGMKWLFEGEDRNRCYLWSASPFYSVPFFDYAMNCPDSQKSGAKLYQSFLRKLSKPCLEVPEAAYGLRPSSRMYSLTTGAREFAGDWIPSWLRSVIIRRQSHHYYPPYSYQSEVVRCLRDQLENCNGLRSLFAANALNEILENCHRYSRLELDLLFTVSSFVQYLEREESSLENYLDDFFI